MRTGSMQGYKSHFKPVHLLASRPLSHHRTQRQALIRLVPDLRTSDDRERTLSLLQRRWRDVMRWQVGYGHALPRSRKQPKSQRTCDVAISNVLCQALLS